MRRISEEEIERVRRTSRPDTPLRLEMAAAVEYLDGSMTGAGLRREAKRGLLVIERVAGKYYTTRANIKRMRELCQLDDPKPRDCGSDRPAKAPGRSPMSQPGSFSMEVANSALDAELTKLERPSKH